MDELWDVRERKGRAGREGIDFGVGGGEKTQRGSEQGSQRQSLDGFGSCVAGLSVVAAQRVANVGSAQVGKRRAVAGFNGVVTRPPLNRTSMPLPFPWLQCDGRG